MAQKNMRLTKDDLRRIDLAMMKRKLRTATEVFRDLLKEAELRDAKICPTCKRSLDG